MADIVVDGRGLPAPEPLERVLDAMTRAGRDDRIRFVIDREPHPLYQILRLNGYLHATEHREDGTVEVLIWSSER